MGKKVVKISLYGCDYLNLVYHQYVIYEFPDSAIHPFPLLVCKGSTDFIES